MCPQVLRAKRSRRGCKTCKRRRKKCDETQPACNLCLRLGLECEGYAQAGLVWGNGIASRGKFRGATVPTLDPPANGSFSNTGGGRLTWTTTAATGAEDERPAGLSEAASPDDDDDEDEDEEEQAINVDHSEIEMGMLSSGLYDESTEDDTANDAEPDNMLDPELFDKLILDFFTSGHHTLYAASKDDSPVVNAFLPLARTSPTLRSTCVAYQALISSISIRQFEKFYDHTLKRYRADLSDTLIRNEDCTIAAGILLCSIGAFQGFPWTFHIEPVLGILTARPDFTSSPFHAHALDILGYYDLPSIIVNRKLPRLDIWRKYCMRTVACDADDDDPVEPVSGLPRSLLDIFCCLEEPDCEEKLWLWPGREGDVLQIYLWDAFRAAAMLKHRELTEGRDTRSPDSGFDDQTTSPKSKIILPSDIILLNRLVASLNALFELTDSGISDPLVMNAILYPLFVAGHQVQLLQHQQKPEWEEMIDRIFQDMVSCNRRQIEPIREILQVHKRDRSATPDQIAAKMGMEIALL